MSRHLKRVIILCVYALLFGGIGFGIRALNTENPTCTDGIRNGAEDGLDCGVVCGKLCDPVIQPLTIAPATLVAADGGYDVLASFENTNSIYGAERIEYVIVVTSADGTFSDTLSGVTYGLPQQTSFVAHHIDAASEALLTATVTVREVTWRKVRAQEVGIDLQVRDESLVATPGPGVAVEARGVVRNASPYQLDRVDVVVLLYDVNETLVGAGSTNVRTLSSGSERLFTVSWRGPLIKTPVRSRVLLSTNALANDAFLETYDTSPERFQIPY
ncbi:MAG: FxLYD domain-containing protein [Patescibacteria group bacterium]